MTSYLPTVVVIKLTTPPVIKFGDVFITYLVERALLLHSNFTEPWFTVFQNLINRSNTMMTTHQLYKTLGIFTDTVEQLALVGYFEMSCQIHNTYDLFATVQSPMNSFVQSWLMQGFA